MTDSPVSNRRELYQVTKPKSLYLYFIAGMHVSSVASQQTPLLVEKNVLIIVIIISSNLYTAV